MGTRTLAVKYLHMSYIRCKKTGRGKEHLCVKVNAKYFANLFLH